MTNSREDAAGASSRVAPLITVLFPLFNTVSKVPALVDALLAQRHPQYSDQAHWLRAIFIDDHSVDATLHILRLALGSYGHPQHVSVIANPENIGLSPTLNVALQLCETEFVLTCHCDCRFGDADYVYNMLTLLERHPDAAAITGRPTPDAPISLEEKVNLIANLQDLFAPTQDEMAKSPDLVYTGFAEGRCDGFRLDAIRAAGFYDTTLRVAGEDQVLSGKFRKLGYNVYQAPKLLYTLSVSAQQSSIRRLMLHQHMFGRTHPYILLRAEETIDGVLGARAGENRRRRVALRASQVISVFVYAAIALPRRHRFSKAKVLSLIALLFIKGAIFQRHLRHIPLTAPELLLFGAIQPGLDICYTLGLGEGLLRLAVRDDGVI